jgi:hypothetical protein
MASFEAAAARHAHLQPRVTPCASRIRRVGSRRCACGAPLWRVIPCTCSSRPVSVVLCDAPMRRSRRCATRAPYDGE